MIRGMRSHQYRYRYSWVIPLLLLTSLGGYAETVYRWQDSEGNRHYGDIPPESAQQISEIELAHTTALYVVEKVIDGDTIRVRDLGKVRLLGINAPEIAHRERAGEPFGEQAHQRLSELLGGRRVYLHFDSQRRDRFDRVLAYVMREDGLHVNELLLQEGLARALFLQPNMLQLENYYRIELGAQQAGRGIWSLREYQIRPAGQAGKCIKQFCRLRGVIRRVEVKRDYIYLYLPGKLQVAIHKGQRSQFEEAGIELEGLTGSEVAVRGWIGSREEKPYLRLQHPWQIEVKQ